MDGDREARTDIPVHEEPIDHIARSLADATPRRAALQQFAAAGAGLLGTLGVASALADQNNGGKARKKNKANKGNGGGRGSAQTGPTGPAGPSDGGDAQASGNGLSPAKQKKCKKAAGRPNGCSCDNSGQCVSGNCIANQCVTPGPQGPTGPIGPTGPQGPTGPGGASSTFVTTANVFIQPLVFNTGEAKATCPAGSKLVGGGFDGGVNQFIVATAEIPDAAAGSYTVRFIRLNSVQTGSTAVAYAVCAT